MGASRIDLQVPFAEKDIARRLGARWDRDLRVWYVPVGVDDEPLRKWIPVPQRPNIRAGHYLLVQSARECWRCRRPTRIFAIMLPTGHEVLWVGDDPGDEEWQIVQEPTRLSYIDYLPAAIAERLRSLAPDYRLEFSETVQSFYWMNHCEQCGAKQGDYDTIEDYGSPFNPAASQDAADIVLREIREPFAASCAGHTSGVEWFDRMRRDPP